MRARAAESPKEHRPAGATRSSGRRALSCRPCNALSRAGGRSRRNKATTPSNRPENYNQNSRSSKPASCAIRQTARNRCVRWRPKACPASTRSNAGRILLSGTDWRPKPVAFQAKVIEGRNEEKKTDPTSRIADPLRAGDDARRMGETELQRERGSQLQPRPRSRADALLRSAQPCFLGFGKGVYLVGGGTHPGSGLPVNTTRVRASRRSSSRRSRGGPRAGTLLLPPGGDPRRPAPDDEDRT